jgi:hypothetical protein
MWYSFTYVHRTLKIELPVRSAVLKQCTGGLVVRWVTTGEYPLLYVFVFACALSPLPFAIAGPVAEQVLFLVYAHLFFLECNHISYIQVSVHVNIPTCWINCKVSRIVR